MLLDPDRLNALFWLICFITLLRGCRSQASSGCLQLLDTKFLDKCCGHSTMSEFIFHGTDCIHYEHDYGPCRFDCLFSHWGLLSDEKDLNMRHVYLMIKKLYIGLPDHVSYGTALRKAYERCERIAYKYMDFMLLYKSQLPTPALNSSHDVCPSHALLFAKCAAVQVFLNCPSKHWRKSAECSSSKKKLSQCVEMMNDVSLDGDADGVGVPGVRNAATGRAHRSRDVSSPWYTAFFNWLVF